MTKRRADRQAHSPSRRGLTVRGHDRWRRSAGRRSIDATVFGRDLARHYFLLLFNIRTDYDVRTRSLIDLVEVLVGYIERNVMALHIVAKKTGRGEHGEVLLQGRPYQVKVTRKFDDLRGPARDTTRRFISRLESGESDPPHSKEDRYAAALGCVSNAARARPPRS